MAEIHKILVIDDEEVVRDSCSHILRRPDQIIKTAADGARGLEILGKEHFDVVILDLNMPILPGTGVLRRLSEEYPDVVVIVITGYATVDSAVGAMKLGAYEFIPKPLSPESLKLSVKKAIEKRRLKMENAAPKSHLPLEAKQDIFIGESPKIMDI